MDSTIRRRLRSRRKVAYDEVLASLREGAERHKELDRQMQETERKMDRLNEQMGGLHNSFGEMAEHLVAPGIMDRFNELGFHFNAVAPGGYKVHDDTGKIMTEVDILLENSSNIMAVEVKAKTNIKDIEHHVKRLEILRKHWNKRGDKRIIHGAIAGAIFGNVEKQATIEAGLYVLVQSGDTMKLDLPEGFVPREW